MGSSLKSISLIFRNIIPSVFSNSDAPVCSLLVCCYFPVEFVWFRTEDRSVLSSISRLDTYRLLSCRASQSKSLPNVYWTVEATRLPKTQRSYRRAASSSSGLRFITQFRIFVLFLACCISHHIWSLYWREQPRLLEAASATHPAPSDNLLRFQMTNCHTDGSWRDSR